MDIIYFAFSSSIGLGGHTRSMRDISNSINPFVTSTKIFIICAKPQVNYIEEINYLFLKDGYNKNISLIKEHISKKTIIHFFDIESYSYFSLINHDNILVTRCGGVNPSFWPKSLLTTTFSKENSEYFKTIGLKNVFYIPNRVTNFHFNQELIDNIKNKYNISKDDYIALRVCRIKKYYQESLLQTLNLGDEISKKIKKQVIVILIGGIEDHKIYEYMITKSNNLNIRLISLTDSIYTSEARQIISIADAIVGTGRSLMEAAKTNAELYVPNKNSHLPIRLSKENFNELLSLNFSGRYSLKSDKNEPLIKNKFIWNKYFYINNDTVREYLNIYKNTPRVKPSLLVRMYLFLKLKAFVMKNL